MILRPVVRTPSYIHTQSAPLSTWSVTHNLGKFPAVTVVDSSQREMAGGVIQYQNSNTLTITFGAAFSGQAFLN